MQFILTKGLLATVFILLSSVGPQVDQPDINVLGVDPARAMVEEGP